jgi:hypothetical protein
MRLRLAALCAVVTALAAAPAAQATPVKCQPTDITLDNRVFPEPDFSTNFTRFGEFECGMRLLEARYPELLDIRKIGTSEDGLPVYDIVMTNEDVKGKKKDKLLVISSIHGDEVPGREGAVRAIEDMVDPTLLGNQPWVQEVLRTHAIHWLFPNPDGWVAGDVIGERQAGVLTTRENGHGRDLNRDYPVHGWINDQKLQGSETRAVMDKLFSAGGWFLGTDNHGQLADTYAAAGLQIVGEFDFQKSETLARFADGITDGMKEYGVLRELEQLKAATGLNLGAYRWGTLYDMLGYSASGSGIDYYNTPDTVGGTGFATEMTAGRFGEINWLVYPRTLNQIWVNSVRAINFTMFKQAIDRKEFTFPVGSKAAYVFDPRRIRHDDANGAGEGDAGEDQQPYDASRMDFFTDLNDDADRPLGKLRVKDVLQGDAEKYDSLVLANDAMPEAGDRAAYFAALKRFVEGGGNLVVTDAAVRGLVDMGVLAEGDVNRVNQYVGYVDFANRTNPLNQGLRGVARQTYDTVPIGYRFGGANSAPNWRVSSAAWTARGGTTAGTQGTGQTIYGELPLGQGKVRFLGALLPDPTEDFHHPYGLQSYAVTYTGYTLLENMLRYERP